MPTKNLDYISITDRNTALVYKELENKNVKRFFIMVKLFLVSNLIQKF